MPDQVPADVVRKRLQDWQRLDRSLRDSWAQKAIGSCRVAALQRRKALGLTEDFLSVQLDRAPGVGLFKVHVERAMDGKLVAKVL